jgi:hypothetical protein
VSLRSSRPTKFNVGDLVEYIPGWREEGTPITVRRWIGFVTIVEVTTIQTLTTGIYQVSWCDTGKNDGWYTDNQLKLLSSAKNVKEQL